MPNLPKNVPEVARNENDKVQLIRHYSVPVSDSVTDNEITTKVELGFLQAENKKLKSRIARLESEIIAEITLLTDALEGKMESYDFVKRRISRLKGSLEYKGNG